MEMFVRSLILSFMLGISCKEYFEIFLKRRWNLGIGNFTLLPAFILGFMVISLTPIPPYIWQPVRLIFIIFLLAQIYFKVKPLHNLVLCLFLGGLIWILAELTNGIFAMLPVSSEIIITMGDPIWCSLLLCLILILAYHHKGPDYALDDKKWLYFGFFPILSISVSMAASLMNLSEDPISKNAAGIMLIGVGITNILAFCFIGNILLKETKMQEMRLLYERTQNQMKNYQYMEQNYLRQKRFMHDYKNQLNTVQGLLAGNQTLEALAYVEKLTGAIQKNTDYVDTNHIIVNVVLNQKYRYALLREITMTIAVNDLSNITISDEDIVTLLVNLIDNALEACEKLKGNRIIQFKMLCEEGELILSIRNPVEEPVIIKGKRVLSTKNDPVNHGIGLLNVDSVIKKNGGTSVLKCSGGWFSFSSMIPMK